MDHRKAVAAAPHAGRLTGNGGASHGRVMDSKSWEKAKDVITDALKRSPSEREAFVREHCPDETLRAEVDALLKHYEEAPDFLEEPPHIEEPDELDDLQPGSHVGPYVIVDRLGRGGMGQVFLGSDPRLRRRVALKCLISSRLTNDDRRRRILDEARAAARISHPNVATVHDVIEHESRAFIVMEYVEGESLAARLKRERLPVERIVAIGRQLASALTAAHATGIVHRDLKPANIQITLDGSVKVLDFGVARALALSSTESVRTTAAGQNAVRGPQIGTPGYMSPEQIMGRDVDDRSDVFSLGVILYEMTTGRRPFPSEDTADLVMMMAKRPPRADADDSRVPSSLADVIAKALEIGAADRFQSAADAGVALEAVERELAAKPTEALTEPRIRWLPRLLVMLPMVPVVLGVLGVIMTAAFNNTFERTGPFGREPVSAYILWGLQSIVAPLFWMVTTALILLAVKFLFRVLSLSRHIEGTFTRLVSKVERIVSSLGMNDPVILGQALAMVGAIAIALVSWRYHNLIGAWAGSFTNISTAERLAPLQTTNNERGWYRIVLAMLTLVFSLSLNRVMKMRRRQNTTQGKGGLIALFAVIGVMVLMIELPYRIFHTESERLDVGGVRCYETGDNGNDLMIYCPDTGPPRNHVIKRIDQSLHRVGVVENVFSPRP